MVFVNAGSVSFSLGGRQPYKKSSNWYDNEEGVQVHLKDLESFHKLLQARSIAHRQREERLNEFFIRKDLLLYLDDRPNFALFRLDEFGQIWIIDERGSATICDLPSHLVLCPECGKGWNIANIQDYVSPESKWIHVPADEFIGKHLKDVWAVFATRTDGRYSAPVEYRVYNPKYVDLTPLPGYETLKVNEWGCIPDSQGKTDPDHIIAEGDVVAFWKKQFYHKDCRHKVINREMSASFREVFEKAGYKKISFAQIQNEYCQNIYCCPDWLKVCTEIGELKIGWRKRVINIELIHADVELNLGALISDDVTKGKDCIHAWGWEKCEEYLRKIREACE